MKVSIWTGLLIWRAMRRHPWCRPRQGWLRWLLFSRRVAVLQDPVWEGCCNNAGPAPEWAPTVYIRG